MRAKALSELRDRLDGNGVNDNGVLSSDGTSSTILVGGTDGLVRPRKPEQLNILYITAGAATSGGFFPNRINGALQISGANR